MNKIILAFALIAVAFAADLSSLNQYGPAGQDLLKALDTVKTDPCYIKAAENFVPQIQAIVSQIMAKSVDRVNAEEDIFALIADFQATLKSCNNDSFSKLSLAELPGDDGETDLFLVAELFLATSQCFQDVGGFLYILDALKQNHSSIPQDIIIGIILAITGKKAIQDCGVVPAIAHAIWNNIH